MGKDDGVNMGYTHYMYRKPKLNKDKFLELSELISKMFQHVPDISVRSECDESTPPILSDELIRFNGVGNEGHETFFLARIDKDIAESSPKNPKISFFFCKTACKPYDIFVVASLILAKVIFEEDVEISSDGSLNEWEDGRGLASHVYGREIKITETKEGFDIVKDKPVSEDTFIKDITK